MLAQKRPHLLQSPPLPALRVAHRRDDAIVGVFYSYNVTQLVLHHVLELAVSLNKDVSALGKPVQQL